MSKNWEAASEFSNQSFFLFCRRKPLNIFSESSMPDVGLGSKCASVLPPC